MLVAVVLFFLGIWRIGLWYNNEVAERQSAYQASRVDAGSDEIGQWPIYTRRPLTDSWVVRGEEFPPAAPSVVGNGGDPGRERSGGVQDCENSDRIEELIQQAREKEAQIDQPVQELQTQAAELDRQAAELDRQAEELDRMSNEQMQRYNDCLGNCEAQRAACLQNCQAQYDSCSSQCLPYLEQAQEYSRQAGEYRGQAQEKRSQASQKRENAKSLMREVTDLLSEAGRLGQECE
jgi:hypothetical protein